MTPIEANTNRIRGIVNHDPLEPGARLSEADFATDQANQKSTKLADGVRESFKAILQSLVCLPNAEKSFSTVDEIATAYDKDWRVLRGCRKDWIQLLGSLVQIRTNSRHYSGRRFTDEGLQAAANAWREEILEGIDWPQEIRLAAGIPFADLTPIDAASELRNAILRTIEQMATSMVSHLSTLTDRSVCGAIDWLDRNRCEFSYCTHEIEARPDLLNTHSYNEVTQLLGQTMDETTGRLSRTFDGFQHTVRAGTRQRKLTIQRHEICDAIVSHPLNTNVSIPAEQQAILNLVPAWLEGLVRIVEGNLIRVSQWQKDLEIESWTTHTSNRQTWVEVTPPPGFDPAIVLSDQFVLSGWLISETDTENQPPKLINIIQKLL
jgi:hypothetical protein